MSRILAAALAVTLLTGSVVAEARDHNGDSRQDSRNHHDRDSGHARGHRDDGRDSHRDARNHRDHDRDSHYDARNHRDHDRHSRYDTRDYRDHDRYVRHRDADRRPVVRHGDVHRHVDVHRHARFHAGQYYRPSGYRTYVWHRGARLPAAYYAPRYVVHDYHAYHLYAPPRGHHWVRVDHDVVLAAITTGVVVAVVNDLFF